ncbi:alpha-1,3-rhamnosyl/mannosyltransferase [Pseudomonas duriflava]|uniref:Alpha-1,3-rhamnosyl/mannosyltransferase n=1 Tax=Pseudomonas duriflava TaxID=459528 RepID=A0A562QIC8_9PSED|nr:glycosyltransferase family 1 protein [Pseudomonas duriflava]TWI56489.1 alpha-1,3-rhamnosyl/mannosyltransferase [Pseudomonas duriflava]
MKTVGFGTTVWAHGEVAGFLDGIGIYTRALWREFASLDEVQDGALQLNPYVFGKQTPNLECGTPQVLATRFSLHCLSATLLGAPLPNRRCNAALDLFHATDHRIPRIAGVPVVATVMDVIPLIHPEWIRQRLQSFKSFLFEKTILSSERIITISEHSKRDIVKHVGIDPDYVHVTPLGVERDYFVRVGDAYKADVLSRQGLTPGFFLFVGTLQPRKNLTAAIEAHQKLPAALRKNHPLVIVGREGWSSEKTIAQLQRLESRGEARWLRYLPRQEVLALLQSASALVFPSLYEGFGLPVLEAFASRCPVITSNLTSLPEVAGDSAWLVDPRDVDALSLAMQESLASEKRKQAMVNSGYQRALSFTWRACAERTLNVYRQMY